MSTTSRDGRDGREAKRRGRAEDRSRTIRDDGGDKLIITCRRPLRTQLITRENWRTVRKQPLWLPKIQE